MFQREVTTVINREACIGCGRCVKVCPSDTLAMEGEKAVIVGDSSLGCDHCRAVCPADAVEVGFADIEAIRPKTFPVETAFQAFGKADTAALFQLMASRRSCRDFDSEQSVPLAELEDLVRFGMTAPSATNNQLWHFSILPDRKSVLALGERCLQFFEKLNRLSEKRSARLFSKLFMKDTLGQYFEGYHDRVQEAIDDFKKNGRDRLFHGAPAAILVSSKPGGSMPHDDCLLATQNMLLAAHAMGYGTCLIGFVVEALKNDKTIQDFLDIPRREKIYAVIAVGKSKEKYKTIAGRRAITPRVIRK